MTQFKVIYYDFNVDQLKVVNVNEGELTDIEAGSAYIRIVSADSVPPPQPTESAFAS